jgi:hypothetical protein
MLPITHTAIAIGIYKIIPNPYISICLCFLSHIPADLFPESNQFEGLILGKCKLSVSLAISFLVEGFCAYLVVKSLITNYSLVILICAIAVNLPDIWDFIYWKIYKKNFWFFHWNGSFPFKVGKWQLGKPVHPLINGIVDLIIVGVVTWKII